METKEINIDGKLSTAEVTHLIEALEFEGNRYLGNHLAMRISGEEGVLREFHDKVTRPNLDRLMDVAEEMGLPLPFTTPLEKRENEIKSKLEGGNVQGIITKGEALRDCLIDAKAMGMFYTVSFNLASDDKVRDAFRRNLDAIMDQKPRLVQEFRNTKEFVAPPKVMNVRLKGAIAKGIKPSEARGAVAGGR